MKKALVGAALLLAPFFSQSSIFENASGSLPSEETRTCLKDGRDPQAVLEEVFQESLEQIQANTRPNHLANPTEVSPNGRVNYTDTCTVYKTIEYEIHNSEGQLQGSTKIRKSITGIFTMAPSCEGLGDNTVLHTLQSGETRCFTPYSLADADSCSQGTGTEFDFFISDSGAASCIKKSDGSSCPVLPDGSVTSNVTGNTTYFYKSATPPSSSICYESLAAQPPPPDLPNIPDEIGECSDFNGLSMCYENPLNVCDSNGNCPTGCGTLSANGQVGFVCTSQDTDNDGIPDYQDPDIDGDGIRNEDDLDSDGDGQDDPINPNYTGGFNQASLSGIEGLLSQIAQNTSGGSGGGGTSGPSASQIGEEVGEKLTEIGDFSTSEYEARIDAKSEQLQVKTDEFLQKDENDLSNAFDESQFANDFTELKSLLAPSSCTANIEIPLTNSNLDLCTAAAKAKPFLWVIFAISTFIYCVRRIQSTARAE